MASTVHSKPVGLHTWTLNPHILLSRPMTYRWAAKHLNLTPTGISFIQLPCPSLFPARKSFINTPRPYYLIEADPDEKTNTWNCRTWMNYHLLNATPEDYLLPLTVHAATSEPLNVTSIGPAENTEDWRESWKAQTQNSLPRPTNPALMTYYQFHRHVKWTTAKLELTDRYVSTN